MASQFHIKNFGCRAARADGEAVGEALRAACWNEAGSAHADVVIVNTCSVTAEADREARAFIRRAHRLNPAAKILVTGCYAQRAPEELAAIEGVSAVVGNSHKGLAPEIILGLSGGSRPSGRVPETGTNGQSALVSVASVLAASRGKASVWVDDRFAHSFLEEGQVTPGTQTRPNLKIQEGCGNRCTFCVIPQTRGGSKSLAAASVLKQVEGFVAAGGQELVLSGINLGRWGRDLPVGSPAFPPFPQQDAERTGLGDVTPTPGKRSLAWLVREIFTRTDLARLRLSSIEPMDWDAEMIGLMAEFGDPRKGKGRLARHAHLPLQSGSDGVLRRMHRRYRPWHYVEKAEALVKAAGPELTLGADVMVGFPGETDAEFEETVALIEALPFGYLHLFPFSPRPGTPGWTMHAERPVRAEVVEERMAALRALAAGKGKSHRGRMMGQELEAITLHTPAELISRGQTAALTENFLAVELEGVFDANRLVRVRVTGVEDEGTVRGEVVAR
jgi:threonylcarbamoyladenosine tRNA methylthiotransferase MtaB